MIHWLPCWDTHVFLPWRTWTFYLFLPDWHFLRENYEIFEISQVWYFLWKLGTKVNQCALVSSVFDYFWIFGGPGNFWPKRRRKQFMPRGWIFQNWNHFHVKTTHWDAENVFSKKSWGCYHVAVVQNWHSFGRFDRQLTRHKMDAQANSKFNHMLKSPPKVP